MATNTPNYALVKPAYSDWADITVLNNNADIIDTQLFAKANKTTQIIAGLGLTGGGDLTTSRTLNIVSANDGIIVNPDNIQLDTQNVLTSTAVNKPLSANMGKVLQDTKLNLTGGTLTGALDGTYATFSGNVTLENIAINAQIGHIVRSGNYAYSELRVKESDSSGNYFRMSSDHNYNLLNYYSSGGLSGTSKEFIRHNKSTGEVTYSGGAFNGTLKAPTIVASNETNTAAIYARYNNLETDQVYLYNNSTKTGIYSLMPTHGELDIISRNKSTGVVSYAGGNYGTINGSTATFSGNVTAPSITIGGYVVTIV